MTPLDALTLTMRVNNESPSVTCVTDYAATRMTVMGPIPAITLGRIDLHFEGYNAAVDYFIQIHSD